MKITLDSKVATHAADALGIHGNRLYSNLGTRIVVIAELKATERNEIDPEEDKEGGVKLQIKHLEVAGAEQEDAVRQALRALFTQRTSYGTITEDHDIELSEETLKRCAGELNAIEAARLHVAVSKWASYANRVNMTDSLTATELRHELKIIADALRLTISGDIDAVAV